MPSRSELGGIWLGPRPETDEEFQARFRRMVQQLTEGLTTMTVRAKFKVTRVEIQTGSRAVRDENGVQKKTEQGAALYEQVEQRTVVLHPVYSNDPQDENCKFWDATPSGELRLGTVNPAAWQMFEIDKEYYLDITPAP